MFQGRYVRSQPAERRYKRISFPAEVLVDFIGGEWNDGREYLMLPVPLDLPADVQVHGVCWDEMARCFWLTLWSASYDVVPDGEMTPNLDHELQLTYFRFEERPGMVLRRAEADLPALVERKGGPSMPINRDQLLAYVRTLSDDVKAIFWHADRMLSEIGDTLCEDFQVIAGIIAVFEARAAQGHRG